MIREKCGNRLPCLSEADSLKFTENNVHYKML